MANTKLTEKLTAIADAIREKTGKSEKMTLAEMPVEIGNIQTGGGGSAARDYEVNDVTFYDYDGTIVYSCSMADAQNLTELPTPPKHKGLVFQEWNWTLEQIKSSSVGADVGAMYDTEDGALVLNIKVSNATERENICLNFKAMSSGTKKPHIKIDWGDGNVEISEMSVSSNNLLLNHSYVKNGRFSIRVYRSDSTDDKFMFTCVSPSDYMLISKKMYIDNIITNILIGSECGEIDSNTFRGYNIIKYVTVHRDLALPNTGILTGPNACGLRFLTIPPTQINMYSLIDGCNAIKAISIPPTIITCILGSGHGLNRIIFPDSVCVVGKSVSNGSNLGDILFGNHVQRITYNAFRGVEYCVGKIILPESVTAIESGAFAGLFGVKEYHLKMLTPPALAAAGAIRVGSFGDTETKIYVPKGTADAYKSATNWAALANYIVEEE